MRLSRVLLALAALALAGAGVWVLVWKPNRQASPAPVKLPVERFGVRVSEIPPGFVSRKEAVSALPRDWLVETD